MASILVICLVLVIVVLFDNNPIDLLAFFNLVFFNARILIPYLPQYWPWWSVKLLLRLYLWLFSTEDRLIDILCSSCSFLSIAIKRWPLDSEATVETILSFLLVSLLWCKWPRWNQVQLIRCLIRSLVFDWRLRLLSLNQIAIVPSRRRSFTFIKNVVTLAHFENSTFKSEPLTQELRNSEGFRSLDLSDEIWTLLNHDLN